MILVHIGFFSTINWSCWKKLLPPVVNNILYKVEVSISVKISNSKNILYKVEVSIFVKISNSKNNL
jgi:hypothetical protein